MHLPSKIRVLDDHTINKIAAGEVIENPSSVVKELTENALDAGATDICVEIQTGGRQLIRITDNGCGMTCDDALLSLERHATSKICAVEDIHGLTTMGFRGEAVPSIAAISKFTLISRTKEQSEAAGTLILLEGGKILKCCPVACSVGTSIEVKSLFFNVPVRRKFQKSPSYDTQEILKILTGLALGYPRIKFRLVSDQETVLLAPLPTSQTFLEQLKERIGHVLGAEFIQNCLPFESKQNDYHIQGWMGTPQQHRQNRTGQYVFINNRCIQSPLVSFAIKDGYGTTLPSQRHPIYVAHLAMPGSVVDVNVHPQKKEVRLRQSVILKDLLIQAIRQGLQNSQTPLFSPAMLMPAFPTDEPTYNVDYAFRPPLTPFALTPTFTEHQFINRDSHDDIQAINPAIALEKELPFSPISPSQSTPSVVTTLPGYLVIDNNYASLEPFTGLCIVDQRAAHARIIFEKLSQKHTPRDIQTLLIPYTLELSPTDARILKQHLSQINAAGIPLKEFGRHSFIIDSLPKILGNIDPEVFVQDLISQLHESNGLSEFNEQLQKKLASAAVKASISKELKLSLAEGQALMQQLVSCRQSIYCPQGKPIFISLSLADIKKYFS